MNVDKDKVLVVGPWISGHIKNWLGSCDEYDARVLTCHEFEDSNGYDVRGCFFFNRYLSFIIFPFFLLYHFIAFRPKLVHVHFLSSYGLLSSFLPGKKIVSIWGTDFNGRMSNSNLLKKLYCFVLQRYDLINSPSKHITDKLLDYGLELNKVLTLQYGVKFDVLSSVVANKSDDVVISSIRNWDELYQVEELISAWEELNLQGVKLRLFGRSNNKLTSDKIVRLVENSNSNIELAGFVQGDDFFKLLAESKAFISIPTMDGTPLSVLECMALKLFPIVSDIPANHEWVDTPDNLYLSVPLKTDELKRCIESLSAEHSEVLDKNFNRVKQFGDIKHNRKIMFNEYDKILK